MNEYLLELFISIVLIMIIVGLTVEFSRNLHGVLWKQIKNYLYKNTIGDETMMNLLWLAVVTLLLVVMNNEDKKEGQA